MPDRTEQAVRPPTVRQAAILVGGLGTRLGSLTADTPKPMMPVGDRPFLAWLLRELCRFGVEEVLLLTGHLSEVVEAALPEVRAGLPRPLDIVCIREPAPAGTGGALHNARDRLAERFLLLNGDSLLDFNWARALADAARDDADVVAHMILRPLADASRYGVAEVDGDRVTGFLERPAAGAPGLINSGVYLLDRRILAALTPECSLERDVLPKLAAEGAVRATVADGYFIDIGVPEDLARAQVELPKRLGRPALFLDRDGVINIDHGYVGQRERFEFVRGAVQAMRRAADAGWHVFVVTNQSGVARGFYSEADFAELTRWMIDEIRSAGGNVDDVRYCPDHVDGVIEAYRRENDWRKPGSGMLNDLIARWRLDPARCVMVGDQPSDMAAAAGAGVTGHRFPGGDLDAFVSSVVRFAKES